MKKYSLNYEGGRCPFGYEYVNAHSKGGLWIDAYCRKLIKFGLFNDPDAKDEKIRQNMEAEANKDANNAYWNARENNGVDVEKP